MKPIIEEQDLVLVEREVISILERHLKPSEQQANDLKLIGLDVLAYLGVQVAIPIVTGLISSYLYDKYKDIQTKSRATEAKSALLNVDQARVDPVSDQTIEADLTEMLVSEGVNQEVAANIAREAIASARQQLKV